MGSLGITNLILCSEVPCCPLITFNINKFPLSFPYSPWLISPVRVLSGAQQMRARRKKQRLDNGGARPGKGASDPLHQAKGLGRP